MHLTCIILQIIILYNLRRVASSDRMQDLQQHPPARKQMMRRRTSMGDALDSSYSESEGIPDQVGIFIK